MKKEEFCEQVKMYRYQLYIVAQAILGNEADAQDAVCSAILKGYEHMRQLKNMSKFKAWMIAITRNEALQIKRKRLELPGDERVAELLEPVKDHYSELWDVVSALKEEYRIVIVMFYYNDLSIKEIAKILGIAAGTVKSRLNRGRELLRQALEGKEKKYE
ncbi:MAG: sigma-70 family RNA polymerase sigma factor [Clostridium sp.]|nr:sigma-70 family RNA polymerase sigma factor [Clostridium sp.]